jgi:maltose/maltodextrin transport system substrate-binding protein/arabinogalactan oligomer/maltooligosaccharide transport system substrate-binding protein
MKNNKLLLLVIALLIGAMVLSACGGGEEAAESPAEEAAEVAEEPMAEPTEAPMEEPTEAPMEEPTEAAEEAAPVETSATLTIWADERRIPVLETLVDEFAQTAGVEVVLEQVGINDMREQTRIAIPAGEGPDIFLTAHDQIGEYVESGLIAPINIGAKEDQFLGSALNAFTYNGQLYGMPYASENVALYRNVDLVPEPVETWDELMQVGGALMDEGLVDNAMIFPNKEYHIYGLDTAYGGYIFGKDAEGNFNPQDVGLDSEGFIAAGEFIQQVVNDGLVPSTADEASGNSLFENGRLAFQINGPWKLPDYSGAGVNFAVDPLPAGPAGPGAPFLGAQGFVVNGQSDNQLLAETFLTELVATDEVMDAFQEADPRVPAWLPTLEKIDDPYLAAFGEITPYAQPMPNIPEMGAVWSSWGDAIQLIMNGEDVTESLTNGANQIRETIAGGS